MCAKLDIAERDRKLGVAKGIQFVDAAHVELGGHEARVRADCDAIESARDRALVSGFVDDSKQIQVGRVAGEDPVVGGKRIVRPLEMSHPNKHRGIQDDRVATLIRRPEKRSGL